MNRELIEKIYYLTNENLENYTPQRPNFELENYTLYRIDSISSFWEEFDEGSKIAYESSMEDILIGINSQKLSIIYLILSEEKKINLYLGINDKNNKILINSINSSFPGTSLSEMIDSERMVINKEIINFNYCAQLLGTPTNKIIHKQGTTKTQIEGVLRGLNGEKWVYIVIGDPLLSLDINSIFNEIAKEIHEIHVQFILKGTLDEDNRLAKHYVELLDAKLKRFKTGKIKGAWNVKSYILAQDQNLLKRGISILTSTFTGDHSLPDRVKAYICKNSNEVNKNNTNLPNIINTEELSIFTQIPREEFSGYSIKTYSKFGIHSLNNKIKYPVYIGEIVDNGKLTGNYFNIDLTDFSKHSLIVGVTGSGKTNTCFNLLSQIWGVYKIPFLVIESAKSEYRDLININEFKECNIFTLGDNTIAPFRLNPFEVSDGILVQSHIDYLKSLFNASFVLYAPMPYILEQSIHEIYEDKGWDLSQNKNHRGENNKRAYPTLTDLYNKIGEVVDKLGYDEKISMDVKAALKARINNLRIGGKGLMLDTRRSISEKDLFEKPTILELKQFVNDEEKAFIIGLILIRLYQYYEAKFRIGINIDFGNFRHVTLIEEAHRLLKNMPTESPGEESSNPKGKAVETFANILSEIRAYGEGIIIAEQIPVKLTPDAIKNTNLKIIHRMVAADDREVMGETANLSEKQKKFITTLQAGEAIVYAEGLHKPFLIKVPNYKTILPLIRTSNQIISKYMEKYYISNSDLLMRFDNCKGCHEIGRNCEKIFLESEKIISQRSFRESFSKLFNSFVLDRTLVITIYTEMLYLVRQLTKISTTEEELNIIYCVMTRYAEYTFESRGNFYQWDNQKVERLIELFNNILKILVIAYYETTNSKLKNSLEPEIIKLSDKYIVCCRQENLPYVTCKHCMNKCFFKYDVKMLSTSYKSLSESFDEAYLKNKLDELGEVCLRAAKLVIFKGNHDALKQASMCFAAHKCADIGLTTNNQETQIKEISEIINKMLVQKI